MCFGNLLLEGLGNVAQLLELVARRLQMVELKWKEKFLHSNKNTDTQDPYHDAHLYEGTSITRGLLCIAPTLERFVGEELAKEALAAKERRKAAEERRLAKKGKAGDGQ